VRVSRLVLQQDEASYPKGSPYDAKERAEQHGATTILRAPMRRKPKTTAAGFEA
jgi:hypothetical protein